MDGGKSVGVFGSISAYPPRPVPGFMVPGPFAPGSETFPAYVQPVQDLNRRYTQVHNRVVKASSPLEMLKEAADVARLGLRPATIARIAAQLGRERVTRTSSGGGPACSRSSTTTSSRTSIAATAPTTPPGTPTTPRTTCTTTGARWTTPVPRPRLGQGEGKYGGAVEYGYRLCDELLGRFLGLVDRDTVVVVASSMGQQPFVSDLYPEGKVPVRFRNLRKLLEMVGARGVTELTPMMLPQWNVRIPDAAERARVRDLLAAARCQGGAYPEAMTVEETGDLLTLTPRGLVRRDEGMPLLLPRRARREGGGPRPRGAVRVRRPHPQGGDAPPARPRRLLRRRRPPGVELPEDLAAGSGADDPHAAGICPCRRS